MNIDENNTKLKNFLHGFVCAGIGLIAGLIIMKFGIEHEVPKKLPVQHIEALLGAISPIEDDLYVTCRSSPAYYLDNERICDVVEKVNAERFDALDAVRYLVDNDMVAYDES